eukprot:symbB.v1.2.017492.t1/scaffold1367.1/size123183/4
MESRGPIEVDSLEAMNLEFAQQLAEMQRELLELLEESDRTEAKELAIAEALEVKKLSREMSRRRSDVTPKDIPGDLPDPEFRESPKAMETPTTACSETDQQSEGGLREANEEPSTPVVDTPAQFLLSRLATDPLRQSAEKLLGLEVSGGKKNEIIAAVAQEIRRQQRLKRHAGRRKARTAVLHRGAPPAEVPKVSRHPPAYGCAKFSLAA